MGDGWWGVGVARLRAEKVTDGDDEVRLRG